MTAAEAYYSPKSDSITLRMDPEDFRSLADVIEEEWHRSIERKVNRGMGDEGWRDLADEIRQAVKDAGLK